MAAAERAIELWIEAAKQLGRPTPQPRLQRVSAEASDPVLNRVSPQSGLSGGTRTMRYATATV
jgi:hypothetical protein